MESTNPIPITLMINMVLICPTSSTYLLWKRHFEAMMEDFNLHGLVDGNTVAPSPTFTNDVEVEFSNPTFAIWKLKDHKLLFVNFSTLSEEAMAEVVDCHDSRSVWFSLEATFAHSSTSRRY